MVFKSEFIEHCDTITHKLTQPTEDLILARNARLRQNHGAINDLGKGAEGGTWGRQVASVPLILWEKAKRNGYDLDSKDKEIREREMMRFLDSVEGRMCLVHDNTVKAATRYHHVGKN
jgi:hypothetical protein